MQGLKFDAQGLITAIAQDRATGEVRMVAWMNAEALEKTLESGLATFYSRSRKQLWVKGETSNHRLHVRSVVADCDGDTLLLLVDPEGPSCHTGRPSCFFRPVDASGPAESGPGALPYLFELEAVIRERQASSADRSYTRSLLDGGVPKVAAKIHEEAGELVSALQGETNERVASEAADLLYHVLVSLRLRDVPLREVVSESSVDRLNPGTPRRRRGNLRSFDSPGAPGLPSLFDEMSKKVLIFEADAGFANELRGGFSRLGCDVTVVDDSTQGLQTAARERPDLILLTVELPRSNGFSVCNKLKRDSGLQAVPVLILSSDSTEETFDHHRRLRGRADDYVKKPVSFDELLERVKKFVTFDTSGDESDASGGAAIVSDDEILLDDVDVGANGAGTPEPSSVQSDDVIEIAPVSIAPMSAAPSSADVVLIDSDVSDLETVSPTAVLSGESVAPEIDEPEIMSAAPPRPATIPPSTRGPSQAPRAVESGDVARFREEIERQKARIRELEDSERAAHARAGELEESVRRGAGRDAEVQRLQRELDEAKAKGASGKSTGGSAREFLDLREQLNKKDKEILELRDQLTHKDKGLLALRDSQLVLERDKADLSDRISDLERAVADATKREEAAKNDKDQASKRAEDFKRKGEKIKVDLDAVSAELSAKISAHEAEAAQRDAREAALRSDLDETKRRAEAELEGAVAATEEQAKKQLEEALATTRAEADAERARAEEAARGAARADAEREFEAKLTAASRANDEALAKLRADADAAADEARHQRDDLTNRVSAVEAELQAEREQLEAERKRAAGVAGRVEKLESELRAASDELESFRDTAAQRAKSISKLESSLEASRSEAEKARQALGGEQAKIERYKTRFESNDAALEKAKDALAAVLAKIEEAQKRDE